MTAIETSGLTKRYGEDVLAVDSLDLTVEEVEVFGFLGPNGAGKSTTIDVLLDYLRPTAGTATVLGFDARGKTEEIHRRISILPDGYGLYDRLSGRKHLEFAIDLKGVDDAPEDRLFGRQAPGVRESSVATVIALVVVGAVLVGYLRDRSTSVSE